MAVLRESKFPDTVLLLDFETYYNTADDKYSLKSLSTIEFIKDPRFEAIGLGRLIMAGEMPFANYEQQTHFVCGPEDIEREIRWWQSMYGADLAGCTTVAMNSNFDMSILAHRYGVYPKFQIDVLALARAWDSRNINSLEALCERFGLPAKGDTAQFEAMTYRSRIIRVPGRGKAPRQPKVLPVAVTEQELDLISYGKNDVMREWEMFTILLPKLSVPKIELRVQQHTTELFTKPVFMVDYAKAEAITAAMNAEIDKVIAGAIGTSDRKEISGDKSFATLLGAALATAGDTINNYQKSSPKVPGKMLLAIAKDDPAREALSKHPDAAVRSLMDARQALDSWPLHIARVERIKEQAKAGGDLLPVPLKYCGAHTGRWSGGEKINLQNLGARGHALIAMIRELLLACPGQELAIADLSAIEARVLAWIAGQADLVQQFRDQDADPNAVTDVYTIFASKVLGWPVRTPKKKGGIPAIEARHKHGRNSIGKVGVLGCGYGMGAAKAEGYAKGAIDFPTAQAIVATYRAENRAITSFWRDVERSFSHTLRYNAVNELPRGLKFYMQGDAVIIELPCGRQLKYHEVRATEEGLRVYNPVEHKWIHVWGGYLVENIVQAMSRNLLAEAIIDIEAMGIHIPLHCHDEVVGAVPKGTGAQALKRMIARLTVPPAWASDLPLNAEGLVTDCYGGH